MVKRDGERHAGIHSRWSIALLSFYLSSARLTGCLRGEGVGVGDVVGRLAA